MIRTRRVATVTTVTVLTLVLSGCVRMGIELELEPDDRATSSLVLAVEDGYLDQSGQSPDDVIDGLTQGQDDPARDAVRTEDFAQDGYTGTRYVYPTIGIDQLEDPVSSAITVVREGDDYVVAGTLDLTEEGLGGRGGTSLENLSVTIDVTFPGKIESANGTIDGSTVHWEPPVGAPVTIQARGSAIDPDAARDSGAVETDGTTAGVPAWLVLVLGVGGLIILLLIGIIVWQALRPPRDRRPVDAPTQFPRATPPQYGPRPYGPPQYGPPSPGGPPQNPTQQGEAVWGHPQEQVTPQDPHRPPSFPPGF